jgi:phenylacetate-CoA ligase
MRQRSWFGVSTGDRYAVFGGQMVVPFSQQKPPFWRYDRASRRMRVSAYHMKPEFMKYYADELMTPGYVFWQGYPSAIGLLCQYFLDENFDLGEASPQAIFPSSETLLDFHSDRIKRVTHAPIADLYANAELSVSVVQCPEGSYHVDTEFCSVEIDPHEETDEWVRGEVISTGFADRAMPFIRYRTGDIATMLKRASCACGRSRPILERIDGRIEDYVVTPDGRRIGRLDHIFKGALEVKEAQILQRSDRRILVRMVPRPGFDEAAQHKLEEEFRSRLGGEIEIEYEMVDTIPRGEDGKFRAVVSELVVGKLQ